MEKIRKKLITCQAILWTNSANKDGRHPVKIRATHDRKSKYYNVQINRDGIREKLFLTKDEWEKARQDKPRGENRNRQLWIQQAENDAYKAYDRSTENSRPFSFERFEAELLANESKNGILKIFEGNLKNLFNENRIGTYKAYQCAYNAFKSFRNGKDMNPADLSPNILRSFETYLKTPKKGGNHKTAKAAGKNSIAMYMRALRVIYNEAIDKDPSLRDFYPFAKTRSDKKGYAIRTGSGKKGEALTVEELQSFMGTTTQPGTPEHVAKLLWLFSFHCQGMNFRDMAYLKYANIKPNSIEYVRRKTQGTEIKEDLMEIPLTDTIVNIIVELGNPDKRLNSYVFVTLNSDMDANRQDVVIKQWIKITNKWLKRLCESNELPAITTYWARHTYASMMKQLNEPIEMIRELLGHSDIKTTESYLKRFDLDRKREANQRIASVLKIS